MPFPNPPKPNHWTLRFKSRKTTILLYVDPQADFSTIKADLLSAVRQSSGLEDLDPEALPSDPNDIEFGLHVDENDLSKGWVAVEISEDGAKKKGRPSSVVNDSPMGAGLKDGMMLAFRFRSEEEMERDVSDDGWNVLVPSYEDENIE